MGSQWSSKLFVFRDNNGQEFVSVALPAGVVEGSQVQVFDATGPYMPIGFPKPQMVDNAAAWMAELSKSGYSFKLAAQ